MHRNSDSTRRRMVSPANRSIENYSRTPSRTMMPSCGKAFVPQPRNVRGGSGLSPDGALRAPSANRAFSCWHPSSSSGPGERGESFNALMSCGTIARKSTNQGHIDPTVDADRRRVELNLDPLRWKSFCRPVTVPCRSENRLAKLCADRRSRIRRYYASTAERRSRTGKYSARGP